MITYKDLNTFTQVLEKAKLEVISSNIMKEQFYSAWGTTDTDLVYLYLINSEELQKDELELLESLNEIYHVITEESYSADLPDWSKAAPDQSGRLESGKYKDGTNPQQIERPEAFQDMGLEDLQDKWDGNP